MVRRAAKRGLVVIVAVAVVGCSNLLPTASPTLQPTLTLHSTDIAYPLVRRLTSRYSQTITDLAIQTSVSNHATLLRQVMNGEIAHFVTTELPISLDTPIWAAPLAQAGIGIAVAPSNPLTNLTLADLRNLYLGGVSDWQELGGQAAPVALYSREAGADIRTEFERLVMGNRRTSPNALVVSSSQAALANLRQTTGGIAYIPLSEMTPDVRLISIGGVAPTIENIAANSYPLRSIVYLVGLEEPEGTLRRFVEWAQSPAGQISLEGIAAPIIEMPN